MRPANRAALTRSPLSCGRGRRRRAGAHTSRHSATDGAGSGPKPNESIGSRPMAIMNELVRLAAATTDAERENHRSSQDPRAIGLQRDGRHNAGRSFRNHTWVNAQAFCDSVGAQGDMTGWEPCPPHALPIGMGRKGALVAIWSPRCTEEAVGGSRCGRWAARRARRGFTSECECTANHCAALLAL